MSRAVPSKTQAIRDAFSGGRPLLLDEIRFKVERKLKQVIGRQKLYTLLAGMKAGKEIDTVGRGNDCFYHLIRKPQ